MNRRVFLVSWLCLASIGSRVWAQRAAELPRLAILSPDAANSEGAAFRFLEAFRDLGYVDGRNIRVESRFAENRLDLLPALAAELVKWRPDVIYTNNTAGALAVARATSNIPIVVGLAIEATMEQLAGSQYYRVYP
jgi:putative ABC transport system substrate-binding protein